MAKPNKEADIRALQGLVATGTFEARALDKQGRTAEADELRHGVELVREIIQRAKRGETDYLYE